MSYNAIHHRRHLLPVHTVLVVLRPEADHHSLTGEYRVVTPVFGQVHLLQYQLLRAWELDLATVLQGSLATLPLAPLADAARTQLPEVLRQMEARLAAEASPEERKDLWTDTFVLLGLRYPRESVAQLFKGIPAMRESDTYRAILEEGRDEGLVIGARRSLLLAGTPRLGEPDTATRQRIDAEGDLAQLEAWLSHLASAESWNDLPGFQP
jgi:predicted transposase YdaD